MAESGSIDLDREIRKLVFDTFLDRGAPPVVEEIAPRFALTREQAEASLDRLDAARHLKLVSGTHRILMAFPFSALATPFAVTLDNRRRYYANCAWDAVAFHAMLHQPLAIASYCHHCSVPLHLRVANGGLANPSPEPPVIYLGLPAREWWTNIVHSCANTMLFFATAKHVDDWRSAHPAEDGQVLTIDQAVRLSEPIYSRKMSLEYERPSREELQRLFASLGLTGPFWAV